mmetsp:Transcript_48822/g.157603  ORF Transcript_48822/g.157603 Transcript_48822/m.157603 type:complete len:201 (-) Transcript_48822:1103-1705(-)
MCCSGASELANSAPLRGSTRPQRTAVHTGPSHTLICTSLSLMFVQVAAACRQSGVQERHRSTPPLRTTSLRGRRSHLPHSSQNACEFVFSLGLKGSLLIYISNLCSTVLRSSCSFLKRTSVHKSISSDFKSTWNFLLMESSRRRSCRPFRHHADRPVGLGARPAERPLGSSALASQRPSGPPGQLCPRQCRCPPGRSRFA